MAYSPSRRLRPGTAASGLSTPRHEVATVPMRLRGRRWMAASAAFSGSAAGVAGVAAGAATTGAADAAGAGGGS